MHSANTACLEFMLGIVDVKITNTVEHLNAIIAMQDKLAQVKQNLLCH